LADRTDWNPRLRDELAVEGITLLVPSRHRSEDPTPPHSNLRTRVRRPVETIASQLVERSRRTRV
jgi:hypothetical protein